MWTTVLLVIHLMIAAALVGVVLLQRSEGGALGMGGGGGGGFLTGRGTANLLTRTTAILAAAFFVTSIGLTIISNQGTRKGGSLLDQLSGPAARAPLTPAKGDGKGGAAPVKGDAKAPADGAGKAAEPPKAQVPSGPVVPQTK